MTGSVVETVIAGLISGETPGTRGTRQNSQRLRLGKGRRGGGENKALEHGGLEWRTLKRLDFKAK